MKRFLKNTLISYNKSMIGFLKRNKFELVVFFIIFLILGFFASKTFLFYDDITFCFSTITKDYLNFYKNYIKDYGFFRPLALIYYFFIYNLYLILPRLTHLIPLALLTITSFLIFKVLSRQGFNKKQSLVVSIFFLSLPFVTEAYSWLSANTSIIVLFIFFFQIYLIEKNSIKKNLLKIILTLQIISIFFYESTIFMSFALAYLLYIKGKVKNKLQLALFSIFPIFTYFISKIVIPPQFENRSKFISISEAFSHWQAFLSQLKMLFSNNYLQNFWSLEFIDGLSFIKSNAFILILLISVFILITFKLFKNEQDYEKKIPRSHMYFWSSAFILSLIPLSWQTDYLPFRTLILPILIFLICLIFIFNFISNNKKVKNILRLFIVPFKVIFIIMTIIFLIIQISMINQYVSQFKYDNKIVLEINKKLEDSGFEHPYRSNLLLKMVPNNNVGRLVYGDYIYGLFHNYWSAEALLDLNSGSFSKLGIEFSDENNFSSSVSKEDFLKLRPLTIMSFTDNQSCLRNECLKVEAVYQNKYK
ncbi:MAG: hypothetical protein WC741_03665 [Patescibacteria group bacterium]